MTAAIVSRRSSLPTAWWGMVLLIASEATLFGCFVATYFYLRFETAIWPPPGIPKPHVAVPLILASCLALSSAPMYVVSHAAAGGRLATARLALVVALVIQCGYLAFEVDDFSNSLARFGISRDAYSSIYYTMLGADHAHVFVGIVFNVWLLGKLARGLTGYRMRAAQAISWYWHFVNVVTFVVVGTLLSAAV